MPETVEIKGPIVEFHSASERIKAQNRYILGPENKWFAGERVGHPPTDQDCFEQWYDHGGREYFNATHILVA